MLKSKLSRFGHNQNRVSHGFQPEITSAAGTAYTDSGTATITFTPSAVEGREGIDATTAQVTFTPAATIEGREGVDAATANVTFTPSGTEGREGVDAATALVTFTAGTASAPASTIVNSVDNNGNSGTATTTVLTVPVGGFSSTNTILVFSSKNATACTDSKGNTYTKDAGVLGSASIIGVSVWRKDPGGTSLVAGDTITLTHVNQGGRAAVALEVSGFLGSPIESSVTNTLDYNSTGRTSGSFNGSAATAGGTVRVFSAWCLDLSASSPTAGVGYAIEGQAATTGTVRTLVVEDKFVGSGVTPTADLSWSGSSAGQAALVVAYDTSSGNAGESQQMVESGTALVTFTPSSVDSKVSLDSDTALVSFTPSASDIHATQDADTAFITFTPSAVEGREGLDSATANVVFTASTVLDWFAGVDASTGLVTFTPSASQAFLPVDATTALVTFTPSGSDTAQFADASTAQVTFTPSGTDIYVNSGDAATATVTFTPSAGTETFQGADSATATVFFTTSATEQPVHTDSDTAFVTFTASASVEQTVHTDTGTANVTFTPSASESKQNVDASTATVSFTPSGTDNTIHTDSGTGLVSFIPSSSDAFAGVDSTTATITFTPSAIEIKAKEYSDSATASVTFTPGGFDSQLGSGDADTAFATYTSSGTEFRTITEDEQGFVQFIPDAIENAQLGVTGTAQITFTPIAAAEPFASTDSDTALVTFTAASIFEKLVVFDSYIVATATYKRWTGAHKLLVSATGFRRYIGTAEGKRWIALNRGRGFLGQ